MSKSAVYSGTMYFSYSQFFVFDKSVKLPGCEWTDGHFKQSFARREQNVCFGTLLEFGHAEFVVHLGRYVESSDYARVIQVPFEVTTGEVSIGGPDEYPNEHSVPIPNGHYTLVAAQAVTDDEHENIALFFERHSEQSKESRIIVADDALEPPHPLLETVDVA